MRRRLSHIASVIAVVVAGLFAVGCSAGSTSTESGSGYPERTTTAGSIDVKARPIRLDADGAAFTLIFDSHAASFDVDPATAITLDVGGSRWPAAGWDGQPPAGHHREGTLRFTAAGAATGTATLTIGAGLPQPAVFNWTIGSK